VINTYCRWMLSVCFAACNLFLGSCTEVHSTVLVVYRILLRTAKTKTIPRLFCNKAKPCGWCEIAVARGGHGAWIQNAINIDKIGHISFVDLVKISRKILKIWKINYNKNRLKTRAKKNFW
jgi:hypothetical protein